MSVSGAGYGAWVRVVYGAWVHVAFAVAVQADSQLQSGGAGRLLVAESFCTAGAFLDLVVLPHVTCTPHGAHQVALVKMI